MGQKCVITGGSVVPSIWCTGLLPGEKKLPVIVFSHGLAANRSLYSSVCSQLASHGFVVAALEHRDGSACGSFTLDDEGEKVWLDFELHKPGDQQIVLRSRQLGTRVEECMRTLSVLERMDAGGIKNELQSSFELEQLKGRLDLSRPIIAGHSFGGCTAINTQLSDKRFKNRHTVVSELSIRPLSRSQTRKHDFITHIKPFRRSTRFYSRPTSVLYFH
ncbi:Platelet-activating factor acetylhydrolase-like [Trinorchestia longiramus]|nr:Platelet-activating factor acetylhydrolase-like [Trinorchestia longiramus]